MIDVIYPKGLSLALSLAGYNALFMGLFVYLKRRDKPGLYYFLTSFLTACWAIGVSFMVSQEVTAVTAQKWGRFAQMALVLMPVTWLHFALVYTEKQKKYRNDLIFSYLVSFAFVGASWTPWYVHGFQKIVRIGHYPVPGPAYSSFLVFYAAVYIYAFWRLYRAWRSETSTEKRSEYRLLFFGQLYGYGLLSLSFIPAYGIEFPQYQLLLLPLWHLFLAYAMIRYHMLDLEEIAKVIQREKLTTLGTVAASINHEIRNPLYVMRGMIEVHRGKTQENLFASANESLQSAERTMTRVYDQTLRSIDIIKRISLFVNHQTQTGDERISLDVAEALTNVVPLIQQEISQAPVDLQVKVEENLPRIHANHRDLEGVFFNLIRNACQSLKDEGGKVWVQVFQQVPNEITVTIQDDGIGISRKNLKKIFNPFFTTKKKGTGLGLYVSKRMVVRNHGKIFVKSKEGKGTTFHLIFPAAAYQKDDRKPPQKTAAKILPPAIDPAPPVPVPVPVDTDTGKKTNSLYGHALDKGGAS